MYRTVLCLTDTENASETLRDKLGPGNRLITAPTVMQALLELRKFTPDLIFVQVCLKDESCFDFLRVAQQIAQTKQIPIIAASVRDSMQESTELFIQKTCLFFGCSQYLTSRDFYSDALRFQLTNMMRKGKCEKDKAAC